MKSRFSEEQIIAMLKEHRAGIAVADTCRMHGISDAPVHAALAATRYMDPKVRGLVDLCRDASWTAPTARIERGDRAPLAGVAAHRLRFTLQ